MDITSSRRVDGLIFDKDGTLFDFHSTWDVWAGSFFADLAGGDAALLGRIAEAAHYDLVTQEFLPSSPIIAGTNREAAECVAQALPGHSVDELEEHLMVSSAQAPLAPAVPLAPYLDGLRADGIALGVMTNDSEYGARAHLGVAGVTDRFDFIAGFDSGFGAKPDPSPLLAFARATSLVPSRIAMVGDSTHDLIAGRAAGMQTIGVLTGLASAAVLAPHADVVLDNIGAIPKWMST